MANELKPCPFCKKTMMLRSALWPSEGDADAIIHANPTDCPMLDFGDGSVDGSIIGKWNCSLSDEDDFPSDGSCVRCGSVPRNANGLCNTCLDEDADRLDNTRPAAPVEGLERYGQNWHDEMEPKNEGDYVLFSQAEAIIATKDDEITNQDEMLQFLREALSTAEADNAALTARAKELHQRCVDWSKSFAEKCSEYEEQKRHTEAIETQLAAARKALADIAEDEGAPFRIKVHALATLEIIYDPH